MTSDRLHPALTLDTYVFRRHALKMFGGLLEVRDENGELVLYSPRPTFALGQDLVVWAIDTDERLLRINTPQSFDRWVEYQVWDTVDMTLVGSLRRAAAKLSTGNEWVFVSDARKEIGRVVHPGVSRARYQVRLPGGAVVATVHRPFGLFVRNTSLMVLLPDMGIDRRLLIAAGILMTALPRNRGR